MLRVLAAGPALAADGPFTIDGVVPDAGATEISDLFGNVKELDRSTRTPRRSASSTMRRPTLGETNPNAQADLRRAWLDTEREAITNDDWLYFAWERDKAPAAASSRTNSCRMTRPPNAPTTVRPRRN